MTDSRNASVRSSRTLLPGTLTLCLLVAALPAVVIHAGAESPFEGKGRIVALDQANGTVTLDHGPIPGLMPPMRMRFPVQPVQELRKLKAGDVVRFSVGSLGDELTITAIERVDETPSAAQ